MIRLCHRSLEKRCEDRVAGRAVGKMSGDAATAASIRGQGGLHEVVATDVQLGLGGAIRTGSNKVRIKFAQIVDNKPRTKSVDVVSTSKYSGQPSMPPTALGRAQKSPFSAVQAAALPDTPVLLFQEKVSQRRIMWCAVSSPEAIDTSQPKPGQTPEAITVLISALAVAQQAPAPIANKAKVKYKDRLNEPEVKAYQK
jgi:hypothetical protein